MEQGENYPLLEKVRSYDYMSGVKSVTTEPLTTENLPIGENIIKYAYPIGHAKCDIKIGEHIHTQNVKSNLGDLLEYENE